LELKLNTNEALKTLEALVKSAENGFSKVGSGLASAIQKGMAGGANGGKPPIVDNYMKEFNNLHNLSKAMGVRIGADMNPIIAQYGRGSAELSKFVEQHMAGGKPVGVFADALGRAKAELINLQKTEKITGTEAELLFEKLKRTEQLFSQKMNLTSPWAQMMGELNKTNQLLSIFESGVSTTLGHLNPQLAGLFNMASQATRGVSAAMQERLDALRNLKNPLEINLVAGKLAHAFDGSEVGVDGFNQSISRSIQLVKNLVLGLAGLAAGLTGIVMAAGLASGALLGMTAVNTGKKFEDMEYQMSTLINMSTKFHDKLNKPVSVQKNLEISLSKARNLIKEFVKDAPTLAGTGLEELSQTASVTLGSLTRGGVKEVKQQAQVIEGITVAVKSILKGVPNVGMQLAQESRALISGETKANATVANQVANAYKGGVTEYKKAFKEAVKKGELGKFLVDVLAPFKASANFASETLDNYNEMWGDFWTNLNRTMADNIGEGENLTEGLYQTYKKSVRRILGLFVEMSGAKEDLIKEAAALRTKANAIKDIKDPQKAGLNKKADLLDEKAKPLQAIGSIKPEFTKFATDMNVALTKAFGGLSPMAESFVNTFVVKFMKLIPAITTIFASITAVLRGFTPIVDAIGLAFDGMSVPLQNIGDVMLLVGTIIGNTLKTSFDALGNAIEGAHNIVVQFLSPLSGLGGVASLAGVGALGLAAGLTVLSMQSVMSAVASDNLSKSITKVEHSLKAAALLATRWIARLNLLPLAVGVLVASLGFLIINFDKLDKAAQQVATVGIAVLGAACGYLIGVALQPLIKNLLIASGEFLVMGVRASWLALQSLPVLWENTYNAASSFVALARSTMLAVGAFIVAQAEALTLAIGSLPALIGNLWKTISAFVLLRVEMLKNVGALVVTKAGTLWLAITALPALAVSLWKTVAGFVASGASAIAAAAGAMIMNTAVMLLPIAIAAIVAALTVWILKMSGLGKSLKNFAGTSWNLVKGMVMNWQLGTEMITGYVQVAILNIKLLFANMYEFVIGIVNKIPGVNGKIKIGTEGSSTEIQKQLDEASASSKGKLDEVIAIGKKTSIGDIGKKFLPKMEDYSSYGADDDKNKKKEEDKKAAKEATEKEARLAKEAREQALKNRELEIERQKNKEIYDIKIQELRIDTEKLSTQKELNDLLLKEKNSQYATEDRQRDLDYEGRLIELAYKKGQLTDKNRMMMMAENASRKLEATQAQELVALDTKRKQLEIERKDAIIEAGKNVTAIQKLNVDKEVIQKNISAENEYISALDSRLKKLAKTKENEGEINNLHEERKNKLQEVAKLNVQIVETERAINLELGAQNTASASKAIEAGNKLNNVKAEEDAIKNKHADEKANLAIQNQLDLTPQTENFADAMHKTMTEAGKGLATDIFTALKNGGENVGKTIMQALQNFGNKILDKMMSSMVEKMFSGTKGGAGGGGMLSGISMFGGLFGKGGGGGGDISNHFGAGEGNLQFQYQDKQTGIKELFNSKTEGQNAGMEFVDIVQHTGGALKKLETECPTEALQKLGVSAGGAGGIFSKLLSGLGGMLGKIPVIGKAFSGLGGLLGKVGGGGGAGGADPLSAIFGIATAGFGIGMSIFQSLKAKKKAKEEKQKKEQQETISKYVENTLKNIDTFIESTNKALQARLDMYKEIIRKAEKYIAKLKTDNSIYQLKLAIDKTIGGINALGVPTGIIDSLKAQINAINSTMSTQVGYLQQQILQLGMIAFMTGDMSIGSQVIQLQQRQMEIQERAATQVKELQIQIEDYGDKVIEYGQKQKDLIASFDFDFTKQAKMDVFGDIAGEMSDRVQEFALYTDQLLRSGFNPEKISYMLTSKMKRLNEQLEISYTQWKDDILKPLIDINNEIQDIINEGRVTGQYKLAKTDVLAKKFAQQAKIATDTQNKMGGDADMASKALQNFGKELGNVTDIMVNMKEQALKDLQRNINTVGLDNRNFNIAVDVTVPNVTANIVKQAINEKFGGTKLLNSASLI